MKKLFLVTLISMVAVSCVKDDFEIDQIKPDLKINNTVGIKLESSFVNSQVSMNVKTEVAGSVTIKIFDISNRVVSKETTDVKVGDNILTVYTNSLPPSAYRIGLYDMNGNLLGITDFNKL